MKTTQKSNKSAAWEKVLEADLGNILRKIKAGKTLTKAEREIVESQSDKDGQPKKGRGRKLQPVRWTLEGAASEFEINPRTLASRIKTGGIEVGEDGKFSTAQICRAVFGDLYSENLRKTQNEADLLELKKRPLEKNWMKVGDAVATWQFILANLRQKILAFRKLDKAAKRSLLAELREVSEAEYRSVKESE